MTIDIDTPTAGVAAGDLLQRWRAHKCGSPAAPNTLFAVYGVASPAGRFADRHHYHPYGEIWLADIAYDHGIAVPSAPPGVLRPWSPSPAAKAMIEHGLSRSRGRRLAMTAASHRALLGYYQEEIAPLDEIRALVSSSREQYREQIDRRLRQVDRHLRAWKALLDLVAASGRPPAPGQSACCGRAGRSAVFPRRRYTTTR